jgi:serine phosphatase RsbU (regulator of sigma subunit)
VLYTDGFLEAAGPRGELFGEDRLKSVTLTAVGLEAESYADLLLERLADWTRSGTGLAQDDDLTLLVIDVL